MISITIDIDRSIDIVWDYFTKPENWEKWYGGGLKGVSPGWQEGAQLVWENGNYSNIIKFIPKQEVSISGTWTDVTYRFSKISNSSTSVQLVESDPKGGAYYTDGGAAHKKDLENSLKKMKIHVENETTAELSEKDDETIINCSSPDAQGNYPDWTRVKEDLSYLPEGLLIQLRKAMVFIVLEDGKEHAAVIVRADTSEFKTTVTPSTPIRMHIDFYSGRNGDIFSLYPTVLDNPNKPFFSETWLRPYDDPADNKTTDPLSAESRKRLRLLLNQRYVWTIFVDNNDQIILVCKVNYTDRQIKNFKEYNKKLDNYAGRTITNMQYFALIQEYLNAVPIENLHKQWLQLFDETPANQYDKGGITKYCPKCNRENEERARFCHNCSANLSVISGSSSKKQANDTSSSVKVWVASAVVILLIFLATSYRWGNIGALNGEQEVITSQDGTSAENNTFSEIARSEWNLDAVEDGTYTGTGIGFAGDITVEVTVSGNQITDITVVEHDETFVFWENAENAIPEAIIDAQNYDVDAVSGSTMSSNGIMDAVFNALSR